MRMSIPARLTNPLALGAQALHAHTCAFILVLALLTARDESRFLTSPRRPVFRAPRGPASVVDANTVIDREDRAAWRGARRPRHYEQDKIDAKGNVDLDPKRDEWSGDGWVLGERGSSFLESDPGEPFAVQCPPFGFCVRSAHGGAPAGGHVAGTREAFQRSFSAGYGGLGAGDLGLGLPIGGGGSFGGVEGDHPRHRTEGDAARRRDEERGDLGVIAFAGSIFDRWAKDGFKKLCGSGYADQRPPEHTRKSNQPRPTIGEYQCYTCKVHWSDYAKTVANSINLLDSKIKKGLTLLDVFAVISHARGSIRARLDRVQGRGRCERSRPKPRQLPVAIAAFNASFNEQLFGSEDTHFLQVILLTTLALVGLMVFGGVQ